MDPVCVFDDLRYFSILESGIQQLSCSKQWYNLVLIFQPPRMQPSQMKV